MIFKTAVALITVIDVKSMDENTPIVHSFDVEAVESLAVFTDLVLLYVIYVYSILINNVRG
jgi:hypothetical protein